MSAEVVRVNGKVTVDLKFVKSVKDEDITVFLAIRDGDKLISVKISGVENMHAEFDIPKDMDDADITVYIWDTKMYPYTEPVPAIKTNSESE